MADIRVAQEYVMTLGDTATEKLRVITENVEVIGQTTPTLRAITENVEVLGQTQPTANVSWQSVEVLGTTVSPVRVTQYLVNALGKKAGTARVGSLFIEVLRDDILSFTVNESLTLTEEAKQVEIRKTVNETLTITETINIAGTVRQNISENISLTENSTYVKEGSPTIIARSANDTLSLTESANQNIKVGAANDTLAITEIPWQNFRVESVNENLILDELARVPETILASATDTLVITEAYVRSGTERITVVESLAVSEFADTTEKRRSISETLSLSETVATQKVYHVFDTLSLTEDLQKGIVQITVVDTLSLTERVSMTWRLSVVDTLMVSEGYRSSSHNEHPVDTLTVNETVVVRRPYYVAANDTLYTTEEYWDANNYAMVTVETGIRESLSYGHDPVRPVTEYLSFGESVVYQAIRANAIVETINESLTLTEYAVVPIIRSVNDTLVLTESNTGVAGEPAIDTLELEETAAYTVVAAKALAELADIQESVSYVKGVPDLCGYSPFIGGSSNANAPTPPIANVPSINEARHGVNLFYPYESPSVNIALRGPEFGNKDRLVFARVNRESRGGTLVVFADPQWPKVEILEFDFVGLSEAEGQSVLSFLLTSLGKEIGLLDWEGNTWVGVVTNPEEALVRRGKCNMQIHLSMEITLTPYIEDIEETLELSEVLTKNQDNEWVDGETVTLSEWPVVVLQNPFERSANESVTFGETPFFNLSANYPSGEALSLSEGLRYDLEPA